MRPTINQVIENPELLNHDDCNSFYDWFCSESSLERRAKAFLPKLKFLVQEGIIDGDNTRVWFKNNCPMQGSLYDDMRISATDEDETFLGGFCPKTGHNVDKLCNVWTLNNPGVEHGLINYEYTNWNEFKKLIKTDTKLRAELKAQFNKKAPVASCRVL